MAEGCCTVSKGGVMNTRVFPVMFVCLLSAVSTGCLPRTTVHKSPGPHDKGIRFYRPKPYLLVKPYEEKGTDGVLRASKEAVQVSMEWLPDFSEEYSIQVRTGLGTNETNITLSNGWNLTQINTKLDSQFDENVNAIANLIGKTAPGGLVREGGAPPRAQEFVVRATNVPIGYYEAMIGEGPDCRKHLYGWRYVGFVPYAACPIEPSGLQCASCNDGSLDLYGLVFIEGVMTFQRIQEIVPNLARVDTRPSPPDILPPPPGKNQPGTTR